VGQDLKLVKRQDLKVGNEQQKGRLVANTPIASEQTTEDQAPPAKAARNPVPSNFLKNPGNPHTAQRCGAKTRRGTLCQRAAEVNPKTGVRKRCRLHGGLSTGPRTPEGKASSAAAKFRHGRNTNVAKEARRQLRAKLDALTKETKGLK
jgi:hypothetical protein